ncbi:MAG: hypothetical protein ACTS3F_03385 [Phycisphaerales bacterium]
MNQPDPPPREPANAAGKQSGFRIGPFVWVPELASTGENDPWKHRKGEPRIFTLFWSAYLLLAAFATLLSTQAPGMPRVGQFNWGARSLLVLIAIGIIVLWPALRLSQSPPPRPARSLIADWIVVMLPVGAMLLPLPLMTGWSFVVAAGLALMLASWTVAGGAIIWAGWRARTNAARGVGTLLGISLAALAPALHWFLAWLGYAQVPWWIGMCSPTSAVFALTESPSGLAVEMTAPEWLASLAPLALGGAIIAIAGLQRAESTDAHVRPA